jgi:hypothetical protein
VSKFVWAFMALVTVGTGAAVAQTAPPSAAPSMIAPADKAVAVPAPMDSSMAKPAPLDNAAPIIATSPLPIGAPLPGANSFTEAQVRQRMEDQGYSGIADLKKDDQFIWRGTARKGGVSMSVALDFQGNIVGTPIPKL